ncbi:MAG: hypothetical protein JRE14_12110 [Deltaproteobacteria bacterium]|nr:hypothetical protein [Deltaproteobacteria bacterium]
MTEDSGPCLIKFDAKKYKININGMIEYDAPKGRKKSIQVNLPKHFYIDAANFWTVEIGAFNPSPPLSDASSII